MVEWDVDETEGQVFIYGSNDLKDWLFNFMTGRTIGDNERVNRWDRYEALIVLRAIRGKGFLTIRGHSRGGAIAQIVARELLRTHRLRTLVCYGSKRAGNQRFVDAIVRSCRFVHLRNPGDWIPMLPPWYAPLPAVTLDKTWRPVWIAHLDYAL